MGRGRSIVERRDPEPAISVDARWVGADLGETAEHAVVRQDGLDEERVGVADHPQVAPANIARDQPQTANATAQVKNSWRARGGAP